MPINNLEWSTITFLPTTDPAWTGFTPPYPVLDPITMEALVKGTSLLVFCWYRYGTMVGLMYPGGGIFVDESLLGTVTPETTLTTLLDNGETYYSVRSGGAWMWYSNMTGQIRSLAAPATLSAFIA